MGKLIERDGLVRVSLKKFSRKDLDKLLGFVVNGAFHNPRYKRYIAYRAAYRNAKIMGKLSIPSVRHRLAHLKNNSWDGKQRFYSEHNGIASFRATLAHKLGKQVKFTTALTNEHKATFIWKEKPPNRGSGDYSYQQDCIRLFDKHRFGMLHLAPSAGKSEIAAYLIYRKQLRTVVSAPGLDTARNIYDRLVKYFGAKNVGLYSGKYKEADKPITVIAWPSVRYDRQMPDFRNIGLWISDECHREPAAQYKFAVRFNPIYRVGLSGSIPRNKQKRLPIESSLGPELIRINEKELEKRNITAKTSHIFLEYRKPSTYKPAYEGLKYHKFYKLWVEKNVWRNLAAVNQTAYEVSKGNRGLVFVLRYRHGIIIEKMLRRRGVRCKYISGSASESTRIKAQNQLRKGHIDVLIGTSVISTGISINEVTFTVSLVGGKSLTRIKQEKGRAARYLENKVSRNYEMYDSFSRLLFDHTKKRIQIIKTTGCPITIQKGVGK